MVNAMGIIQLSIFESVVSVPLAASRVALHGGVTQKHGILLTRAGSFYLNITCQPMGVPLIEYEYFLV